MQFGNQTYVHYESGDQTTHKQASKSYENSMPALLMLKLHVSEVEIPAIQTIRCFLIRIARHRTLVVERTILLFVIA